MAGRCVGCSRIRDVSQCEGICKPSDVGHLLLGRNQTPFGRKVATIHHLPQRQDVLNLPEPGHLIPRLTFRMPFGPSKTAVPPITLRTVQPLMVAGLVSGTAMGRAESFVRSTTVGAGESVFCFVGKETAVGTGEGVACLVGKEIAFAS